MREACSSYADLLTGLFSRIVQESMTVQLLRELDDLDVTFSQLQALTLVAERGPCPVGAVAEGLGISHPAAVKVVEKLAGKALLTRRSSECDHRQTLLSATAAGRNLVNRVRAERTRRLLTVLDRMSETERQELIRGLQGFITAALRNERALDALCVSCQSLLPTDCSDFPGFEGMDVPAVPLTAGRG